jgi:hypothetical protein
VTLGFLSSCCTFPLSFGFLENADSNVAPPPYLGTAVGAGYETVISRMVWDGEFIAAARHLRGASGMARAVHSG